MPRRRTLAAGATAFTTAALIGALFVSQPATSTPAAAPAACSTLTGEPLQDCRLDSLEAQVYGTPTTTPATPTPTATPASDPFVAAVRAVGGVTHAYSFDATNRAKDLVGTVDGTVKGTGTTFGPDGATFDGKGYIELPDNDDFSAATTGGMTVVADVEIDSWKGAGASEYVHWMGKGVPGAHEWTFRHYVDGGTGEAPQRQGRVSFYHFNPAGGLGAGSYYQDSEDTAPHVVTATVDTKQIQLFKDGTLRDTDPLSGYSIVPKNTTTPVRIGSRGDNTGFLVGKIRRVAFFNRVLTPAVVQRVTASAQATPTSTPTPSPTVAPPTLTPTPTPSPTPSPTAPATGTPAGYQVFKDFDLSGDEGWTKETGKPSNADGSDRPANCQFGKGPDGTSALILGSRDTAGGTFYTCDAKALFAPLPNYVRTRAVVEFDPMVSGMWPAVWKRPSGAGEGEIDDWEKFGGHLGAANEDAGTLHTTPYDSTHKQVSRNFVPKLGPGRHTIETELKPGLFTWWVDGTVRGTVTKAQFDAATTGRWDAMFGNASKKWYLRLTLQAGGKEGGPIPASLTRWQFFVHSLTVYTPTS